MAAVWGQAWGNSWGAAWGSDGDTPVEPTAADARLTWGHVMRRRAVDEMHEREGQELMLASQNAVITASVAMFAVEVLQ